MFSDHGNEQSKNIGTGQELKIEASIIEKTMQDKLKSSRKFKNTANFLFIFIVLQ